MSYQLYLFVCLFVCLFVLDFEESDASFSIMSELPPVSSGSASQGMNGVCVCVCVCACAHSLPHYILA